MRCGAWRKRKKGEFGVEGEGRLLDGEKNLGAGQVLLKNEEDASWLYEVYSVHCCPEED